MCIIIKPNAKIEWNVSHNLTPYPEAITFMENRVHAIAKGDAAELVWLVEHPPLYTAGTSAKPIDLKSPERFPVFKTARGGQFTYHGPGQRVIYIMLDVGKRGKDIRLFVKSLEQWVIATLAQFGVEGITHEGRVGVWVKIMRLLLG